MGLGSGYLRPLADDKTFSLFHGCSAQLLDHNVGRRLDDGEHHVLVRLDQLEMQLEDAPGGRH